MTCATSNSLVASTKWSHEVDEGLQLRRDRRRLEDLFLLLLRLRRILLRRIARLRAGRRRRGTALRRSLRSALWLPLLLLLRLLLLLLLLLGGLLLRFEV